MDRLSAERNIAIWCALLCVAMLCLAQLLVPIRKAESAPEPACTCTCLPPDGFDAALFCRGGVNLRLRKPTPEID